MRSVRKATMAAALIGASLFVQGAFAHEDRTSDPSRCDTWYRPGHGSNTQTDNAETHQGDSHHHESSSDRAVAGTTIHAHSGHYAVRHQAGYVEVVGGQSYSGPASAGYGQGGWVQGEVDHPGIAQDADFHANVFGPAEPNTPVGERGNTGGQVCANLPTGKHSTGQITIPTGR